MKTVNIKNTKICAFCRYWYDPTNSTIQPKNTVAGFWEYNSDIKNKCIKTNLNKPSWTSCGQYECKI